MLPLMSESRIVTHGWFASVNPLPVRIINDPSTVLASITVPQVVIVIGPV